MITGRLDVPLGRTADGAVYVADLAAMPNLLIGGAPGTGARPFLHGLLASLLLRYQPTEVRLLLVDAAGDAARRFADVPHLLAPALTDPFDAAPALRWALRELEQRYRQLWRAGARNLDQYNQAATNPPLPRVVIVFTALAPMMQSAKAEAEACVMDLCWMSRAAGIHLVVMTEDLSVAVLSGMVNVSMPARIVFKVLRPRDSLTMVFRKGAEDLRFGDALFLPAGSTTPVLLHAPVVRADEVRSGHAYLGNSAPHRRLTDWSSP